MKGYCIVIVVEFVRQLLRTTSKQYCILPE